MRRIYRLDRGRNREALPPTDGALSLPRHIDIADSPTKNDEGDHRTRLRFSGSWWESPYDIEYRYAQAKNGVLLWIGYDRTGNRPRDEFSGEFNDDLNGSSNGGFTAGPFVQGLVE